MWTPVMDERLRKLQLLLQAKQYWVKRKQELDYFTTIGNVLFFQFDLQLYDSCLH